MVDILASFVIAFFSKNLFNKNLIKIIIIKILRLNLALIKRQISGYPKFVEKFENNFTKYIINIKNFYNHYFQ